MLQALQNLLEYRLINTSTLHLTVAAVLYIPFGVALVYLTASLVTSWLFRRVLGRSVDVGTRHAARTLLFYLLLLMGILGVLESAGVKLSSLHVFAGAFGLGAGFGMQTVLSDFFAGVLLLMERTVRVGDRVSLDDVDGDVIAISHRTTILRSNDGKDHIVPNSMMVTNRVVNWTHAIPEVRLTLPVTVPTSADLELVERLLLEAADQVEGCLKEPSPQVRLLSFGSDGLCLELRVWTVDQVRHPHGLIDQVYRHVLRKLREHQVDLPCSQCDLHLRSVPEAWRRVPLALSETS